MPRHDRAHRAAPARPVQGAAGERAQLRGHRRRAPRALVLAPAGTPAGPGGAAQRAQARVIAGAAVIERGAGEVADAPSGLQPARLPLGLVAVQRVRGVERADALDRRAPQRHVGAPGVRAVTVGIAEVLPGDGTALAPAGAKAPPLDARPDRPGQHADVGGQLRGAAQQRLEPAGRGAHVVVDEHQQLGARRGDRAVARGVEPERAVVDDAARAVARRDGLGRGARAVVDDDQLGAVRGGLRRDRCQRDVEVIGTVLGRDDDRGARRRAGNTWRLRVAGHRSVTVA